MSHLDLVRVFQRASRRGNLPVTITKGFSPRLKISITRALRLGLEATAEEAVFYMDAKVDTEDFLKRMNEKLPPGIEIKAAEEII